MSMENRMLTQPKLRYPFVMADATCAQCSKKLEQASVDRYGRCANCAHPHNRRSGVGVDIQEYPLLFQQATETTGLKRGLSLLSADAQLMTDAVMDPSGTGIMTTDIAKGAYGDVLERYIKSNGTTELTAKIRAANASIPVSTSEYTYATKIINSKHDNLLETATIREFVMRNLDDPGIAKIGAVDFRNDARYDHKITTYISMDMAPMTLHNLIQYAIIERRQVVALDNTKDIKTIPLFAHNEYKMLAYQLIRSVAYLHSELIIHGDIKPANILVSAIKNVPTECMDFVMTDRTKELRTFKVTQLTDFGLCRPNYTQPIVCPICTLYTTNYRPPEFIFGVKGQFRDSTVDPTCVQYSTPKSDIWAMGCVLYEMATGHVFMSCSKQARELNSDSAEIAKQMILAYGSAAFADKEWFPCYNTPRMQVQLGNVSTVYANPWDDKALTQYPGLEQLLRNMLEVDPMHRIDMFNLMHNRFFQLANVGGLFNAAMHTPADKITNIVYRPDPRKVNSRKVDLLKVDSEYVISHMLKYLPSERNPTHESTTYQTDTYRRLAAQLPISLKELYAGRMKDFSVDIRNRLESNTLSMIYIWSIKNDHLMLSTDVDRCPTIVMVMIMLVLKTWETPETNALWYLGYDGLADRNTIIVNEYKIVRGLDFDVWFCAPYDYCVRVLANIRSMDPTQNVAYIQKGYHNAKTLLRVLSYDPDVVRQLASIQLVDSVLDICVRSKVAPTDLDKYKSLDPHYSQLGSKNVMQIADSVEAYASTAQLTEAVVSSIIADIEAYSKSDVVYYN